MLLTVMTNHISHHTTIMYGHSLLIAEVMTTWIAYGAEAKFVPSTQ
jgi:hypothetical protein